MFGEAPLERIGMRCQGKSLASIPSLNAISSSGRRKLSMTFTGHGQDERREAHNVV